MLKKKVGDFINDNISQVWNSYFYMEKKNQTFSTSLGHIFATNYDKLTLVGVSLFLENLSIFVGYV